MENNESDLTEMQSFELITQMINKAKKEYKSTGIAALVWGILIMICALVSFGNYYWKIPALDFIWFLTTIAVVVQIIVSVKAARRKQFKTYNELALGGIWISFGVIIFFLSILFQRT